ncbi:MAG: hypothetical protein QOF59_2612, partial [Actinomycetota bacterium]|nr:hypothetical protein [Actinomycetota bacterium]
MDRRRAWREAFAAAPRRDSSFDTMSG